MRDPHVESMRYVLKPHEGVKFDNAPPIECKTHAFSMRLESDTATFKMREHHASEQTARQCVEEWLRVWELDAGLRFGSQEIEFVFRDAEMIDRDPPPPGTTHYARVHITGSASVKATGTALRGKYPDPPTDLRFSPDVDSMWHRFLMYSEGNDLLAYMAYYCLSLFEDSAGGRREAASQYNVEKSILRKLGNLTSTGGDPKTARKVSAQSTGIDFTAQETSWIKAAVRALIRRKAEYDFDPEAQLHKLTMDDLPAM